MTAVNSCSDISISATSYGWLVWQISAESDQWELRYRVLNWDLRNSCTETERETEETFRGIGVRQGWTQKPLTLPLPPEKSLYSTGNSYFLKLYYRIAEPNPS